MSASQGEEKGAFAEVSLFGWLEPSETGLWDKIPQTVALFWAERCREFIYCEVMATP